MKRKPPALTAEMIVLQSLTPSSGATVVRERQPKGAIGAHVLGALMLAVLTGLAGLSAGTAFGGLTQEVAAAELNSRVAVQVLDDKGRFIGALPLGGADQPQELATTGAVALPPTLAAGLTALEDRRFPNEPYPCHTDWGRMAARIVSSRGEAGGSGIAIQTAKALYPKASADGLWDRVSRRLLELGRACRLAERTTEEGDMLRLYASLVPMAQGSGVTLGPANAAQIVFGKPLSALSDAEQLILAAAVRRPIPRPDKDFRGCDEPATERQRVTCVTLRRASHAAQLVLTRERKQQALDELARYERTGFRMNDAGIDDLSDEPRLWNAVARVKSILPGTDLGAMRAEALRLPSPTLSSPLTAGLVAEENYKWTQRVGKALSALKLCTDVTAAGRIGNHCDEVGPGDSGGTLVVTAEPRTGLIDRSFSNIDLDQPVQIGSISKIVGVIAMLRSNSDIRAPTCALAAKIGGRSLRRAGGGAQAYGVAGSDCDSNTITVLDAFRTSDSLAFLRAVKLYTKEEKLLQAAKDLGFSYPEGEDRFYATSYGTMVATPRQIMNMWLKVVRTAYGVGDGTDIHFFRQSRSSMPAEPLLLTEEQASRLREMIEAPTTGTGTLSSTSLISGKTGTNLMTTSGGREYDRDKIVVGFDGRRAGLMVLTGGSGPLGHVSWSTLAPVVDIALTSNFTRNAGGTT